MVHFLPLPHLLLLLLVVGDVCHAQPGRTRVRVHPQEELESLLADEDTDGDKKITVDDTRVPGTDRGDRHHLLHTIDGSTIEVNDTWYLSNLLQELALSARTGRLSDTLRLSHVFELPTQRISRLIRERCWPGLTRTIDEKGFRAIIKDDKLGGRPSTQFLYVASTDDAALRYFRDVATRNPAWNLDVESLPVPLPAGFADGLENRHGLISLAMRPTAAGGMEGIPIVVPGGRFNELYGWDSYFIALGLLHDGRIALARSLVDQQVYEIEHFGKVLNANRTYYLTRSQPPFLTSMAREVARSMPHNTDTRQWLAGVLRAAIREYTEVWTAPDHMTPTGLSRYFDSGKGIPPEVEPGHYAAFFAATGKKYGMDATTFERAYRTGALRAREVDTFLVHDRAMRESGHDTSYRLVGCCADLVTVDLNALLYKVESDIAELLRTYFGGVLRRADGTAIRATTWTHRARARAALLDRYCWNETLGFYVDYNFRTGTQHPYVSATTLFPLWAGAATPTRAATVLQRALPLLEQPGGIASSDSASPGAITPVHPQRQWDYPFGWAPHQMIAWRALQRYGATDAARRLAYRWLYTITINAERFSGTITEKYDVVRRTHQVFAEYGNIGTQFSYITPEGFGWTNASYQLGLDLLTQQQRLHLNRLVPPEALF